MLNQQLPAHIRDDLQFRLNGRIDHLLLDEFQDTSRQQWAALQPLIEDVLSEHDGSGERSCFIVGDSKQAIYAWRGGCSAIMQDLRQHPGLPDEIAQETMEINYRSSEVVLNSVNQCFSQLATASIITEDPVFDQAARSFAMSFTPHKAARSLAGETAVFEYPAEWEESPILVAEHIAELRQQHLVSASQYSSANEKDLYQHLLIELRERNIPAIGEGGVHIDEHPLVRKF